MNTDAVAVETWSSYAYAVEPRAFRVKAERRVVRSVERRWRTPGQLHFYVRDEQDELVELIYNESPDTWSLREFGQASNPTQPSPDQGEG